MRFTDIEARERSLAAQDDIAEDKDFDRLLREHLLGDCDTGSCLFCEEDWERAIKENQGG